GRRAPTLLTPHDREFERVAGPLGTDRVAAVRRAAAELGVTVLLKGQATIVAGPDGRVLVNPTGSGWLATAGTGDVLSGLGGALLAAGLDPLRAAAAAAYLHGLAGSRAAGAADRIGTGSGAPITAMQVVAAIPGAIRALGSGG
ncbi:MAG: NAD(P)H-hydrate dehydratase, partial [Geodermatophilaceae bacterium]